jgi:dipeptidyl aminopeptidase/acylaminoacyl peptidase
MTRRLLVVLLLVPCLAWAQAKRSFTFGDMMALKRVAEPAVSPDGRWVLFAATHVDLEANTRIPHVWVVPVEGGEARQLTRGEGEDRPRWAPDGKRFVYGSRKDSQVWAVGFDPKSGRLDGEGKPVTSISTGAEGVLWSPDGKNILFVSEVYPDCPDDPCNKMRDEEKSKSKVKAAIYTRLLFRHWSKYEDGKRSHLFVVPAEGGTARDLTPGDYDVPSFNLGGQDRYAFSPHGSEVAYASNHDPVEATSTNEEIFVVKVATGETKQITTNKGADSSPLFSPDGRYIAYRAQLRPGYESDRWRLMLYERATGKITNLTEKFDRWVGSFVWGPHSKRIYFSAEDKGESPIYAVFAAGGEVRTVLGGHNDDLAVTPDGKTLLFIRMSAQAPNEIYRASTEEGATAEAVTALNREVYAQVHMSALERFWFRSADGLRVQGFLVKPPQFNEKKKYPVKFLVHGGPQGAWGDSWTYRWNAQLFAASGYVVVMINFRGSTGYGQAFIDKINGDWGGGAYLDLMTGLDYALGKYPFLDRGRVCALGASFGGYMANWIAGRTTRFQCLVSHDGIFNSESFYGSTEELWFPEWEFHGTPWTNPLTYRKWSPHRHARRFKTPTLVIHGQLDYRVDVSEGLGMFTALQRQGVPSKFLYFPDEGHWVLKPQNSRLWYQMVNAWVDEYLKKK